MNHQKGSYSMADEKFKYDRHFELEASAAIEEVRKANVSLAALYNMQRKLLWKLWRHHDNMANGAPTVNARHHQELAHEIQAMLRLERDLR